MILNGNACLDHTEESRFISSTKIALKYQPNKNEGDVAPLEEWFSLHSSSHPTSLSGEPTQDLVDFVGEHWCSSPQVVGNWGGFFSIYLSVIGKDAECVASLPILTLFYDNISEKGCPILENDETSNRGTLRSVTTVVCSCLLQMRDDFLVFQMLETVIVDQILLRPALDNLCALFRVLVALDCRPTRLSQQSILTLSNFLPGYLMDVVMCFPESDDRASEPVPRSTSHYYLLPLYFLFYRSDKLLNLVLNRMGSLVIEKKSLLCSGVADHSSWINPIVSVVLLMHKDVKIQKALSSCKAEIELILDNILVVQVPSFPSR
ncbi:hypothetical protein Vadar_017908 [Vaccinium darrowii]|uniref:Uncharacterized protein n=1 Tax=Vaccinium darrowii TaxID=229202 RepID=A0ACB7XSM7_9ERIC|nr:hypothetical protein Vadar_017908 [Vaccinium darrowii]